MWSESEMASPLVSSLRLPAVRKFSLTNHSFHYGALSVAAEYCGLDYVPENLRGVWQHGWIPDHWQLNPVMMAAGIGFTEESHHWVARKKEADYLCGAGYKADAIGLPIVYLPREEVQRRPGSLLVMPAHSLDYTTHSWKFDEYADEIARIRGGFSEVLVCVHPSCWKRGYWVEAFRERGFEVVQGAMLEDLNALRRLQTLLSAFEYVTTNSLGSHVVYASYFGAKVSVFGAYAEFRAEDFASDQLYVQYPQLLKPTLRIASEGEMRRHYTDLFCHPLEAPIKLEWGRRQVGYYNRVNPAKLRSLFRWRAFDGAASKIWEHLPWRVRHIGMLAFEPNYRRRYIENRWLGKPRP